MLLQYYCEELRDGGEANCEELCDGGEASCETGDGR
jgi:hypothetical protein